MVGRSFFFSLKPACVPHSDDVSHLEPMLAQECNALWIPLRDVQQCTMSSQVTQNAQWRGVFCDISIDLSFKYMDKDR